MNIEVKRIYASGNHGEWIPLRNWAMHIIEAVAAEIAKTGVYSGALEIGGDIYVFQR
jgi:hypothetical protein